MSDSLRWCTASTPTECPLNYGEIQRGFAVNAVCSPCVGCPRLRVGAMKACPGCGGQLGRYDEQCPACDKREIHARIALAKRVP